MSEDNKNWPAWRYGPNDQAAVFESEDDVPKGWVDHPSKVKGAAKQEAAEPPKTPAPKAEKPPAAEDLDAHGHAYDPKLHAATQSKTKDGLWRMKVGVKRPDPAPGYPKPPLDL